MAVLPDNIFSAIPPQLNEELLEVLAQSPGARIERIVSQGHCSPPDSWYDQAQHEFVIVLQGEAVLRYASGEELRMVPGSYVNIPAHTRHRVQWTDPEGKTVWLAVFY